MPVGWKYLKSGQCTDCTQAGAQLFVPVIEGTPIPGYAKLVGGEHIPHFEPVCSSCRGNYSLDVLCSVHRLPIKTDRGMCKNCLVMPKKKP